MKIKWFILLIVIVFTSQTGFSQCTDSQPQAIAQHYCKRIAESCSNTPNKLTITVTECLHYPDTEGALWEIWSTIEWKGRITAAK